MTSPACLLDRESSSDVPHIEALLDLAFGLDRHTKTSYRLREGNRPVPGLSFVARDPDLGVVGAISFWPLKIGRSGADALLLGPLAVHPERQNIGIGRALMRKGLGKATALGHRLVILVGDEPYYSRVGFSRVPEGRLVMPGPVDSHRLLYLELVPGALARVHGLVLPPHRYAEISAAFAIPHRAEPAEEQAQHYQC
jgi:predicted N-acetyltransferase YhbS